MKISLPIFRPKLLPALGVVVFALSSSYGRTVITNDGFTLNNQALPNAPDYGSHASELNTSADWSITEGSSGVIGTPDIALTWSGGQFDTYTDWDGRGNVVQLDSFGKSSHVFNITFAPSETAAVNVASFVLDAWSGAGSIDIVANWSLTNLDGSEVYSSGAFTMPAASGGSLTIAPDYTGSIGQSLVLRIDQVAGHGQYLALDDLTFDQVVAVPEPSTVAFLMLGSVTLVAAAGRRLPVRRTTEATDSRPNSAG